MWPIPTSPSKLQASGTPPSSYPRTTGAQCRRLYILPASPACATRFARASRLRSKSVLRSSTGELDAGLHNAGEARCQETLPLGAKAPSREAPFNRRDKPVPEPSSIRTACRRPRRSLLSPNQHPAPARLPDIGRHQDCEDHPYVDTL